MLLFRLFFSLMDTSNGNLVNGKWKMFSTRCCMLIFVTYQFSFIKTTVFALNFYSSLC